MDFTAIFDATPSRLLSLIGRRARARRLAGGWTQAALATNAGVSRDVVKRLEGSGRISLDNLARLVIALDAVDELRAMFPPRVAKSLDELDRQVVARGRVYGVRKDSGTRRAPAASKPGSCSESES